MVWRRFKMRAVFLFMGLWTLLRCQSASDQMRLENLQRFATSLCSFYNVAGLGSGKSKAEADQTVAQVQALRHEAGPVVESLLRDLRGRYGPCKQAADIGSPKLLSGLTAGGGAVRLFQITTEKKIVLDLEILQNEVSQLDKMRVLGLQDPKQAIKSLADVNGRVVSLAPKTDFLIWNMASQKRHEPGARSSEKSSVLAVGALANLFILEAVRSSVAAGALKWTDQVEIIGPWKSLPQGGQRDWPIASTASISELAEAMMFEGDNTAADHLLFHLGRATVERVVASLGASSESRNVPFLARSDLRRIQVSADKGWKARYDTANAGQRRKMLDEVQQWQSPAECQDYGIHSKDLGKLADGGSDPEGLAGYALCRPQDIDRRQWFFKPSELCSVLNILIASKDTQIAKIASRYLWFYPGLTAKDSGKFEANAEFKDYVFESASPGVFSFVSLKVDRKHGNACVSAVWNNINKPLDEPRIRLLVRNILRCSTRECRI